MPNGNTQGWVIMGQVVINNEPLMGWSQYWVTTNTGHHHQSGRTAGAFGVQYEYQSEVGSRTKAHPNNESPMVLVVE